MSMHITDPPKALPKHNFGIGSSAPHPTPLRILVAEFVRIRGCRGSPRSLTTSATVIHSGFSRTKILNGVAPHPHPLPGVPGRGSYASAVPNPRREWLTAVFRWLALAGMAAVATVLGLRRSPDTGQPDCLRGLPCGQCGLNRQCELPPAAVWRDAKERNT